MLLAVTYNNLRFWISPFFIHKFYLYRDLKTIVRQAALSGRLLDVGCGEKPYEELFKSNTSIKEYVGIDFRSYSKNKDFNRSKPDLYFGNEYKKNFLLPIARLS